MQPPGLAQARASNMTAGQRDCMHQQTSPWQLNWAGAQEQIQRRGKRGFQPGACCCLQQACCGFLVPETVVCRAAISLPQSLEMGVESPPLSFSRLKHDAPLFLHKVQRKERQRRILRSHHLPLSTTHQPLHEPGSVPCPQDSVSTERNKKPKL